MHAVEQMRRRVRRATPVVANRPVRKVRIDVAWVRFAARPHEREHCVRTPRLRRAPARAGDARMHQRVRRTGHEAVIDEGVLLDVERLVVPLEIAVAITGDPMAERQILCTRRRADRIGLLEAERRDRLSERRRRKQAARHSVAAQRRKRHPGITVPSIARALDDGNSAGRR
jgi:hypothetical protein